MSRNVKSTALMMAAMMMCFFALAQKKNTKKETKIKIYHQRWELGALGGLTQYQGDMNSFGMKEINLGLGGLVRYHHTDNLALRLNFLTGDLTGNDLNSTTNAARNLSFQATARELAILAEYDFMGKRRFQNGFQKTLSPYIFGGIAASSVLPETSYFKGTTTNNDAYLADKNTALRAAFLTIPIGLGLKYDLTPQWTIGGELGYRLAFNDYLDGVSQLANPSDMDAYAFAGIVVGYRISNADTDGDGVRDALDRCPTERGTKQSLGCPDTDHDGVADEIDKCPAIKGKATLEGCPDSDNDGVSDDLDKCPNAKGTVASEGCPDTDADGVHDGIDACPNEKGMLDDKGCPQAKNIEVPSDSDNDGVVDNLDKCPTIKGLADNNGCPKDTDKDGFYDNDDKCPTQAGKLAGCPDTDSDGVADNEDKCPNIAGTTTNKGCPAVSDADQKTLENAIYGVQFESGRASFKSLSYPILDNVAAVMQRNPSYHLRIGGHTDNVGGDKSNLDLSEQRARACFAYLMNKGVESYRMSHTGYGKSKPIADNATAEGRAKNRRVTFELELK